jgi:hypothetical protein
MLVGALRTTYTSTRGPLHSILNCRVHLLLDLLNGGLPANCTWFNWIFRWQARLQDLGAPVRLIKWGLSFCSNSITNKIKSDVHFIYYITSECAIPYNTQKIASIRSKIVNIALK